MGIIRNFALGTLLLIVVAAKPDCDCGGNQKHVKGNVVKTLSSKKVKAAAGPVVANVPAKVITPVSFLQEGEGGKAPLVVPPINRELNKEVNRAVQQSGKKPVGNVIQGEGETHITEIVPQGFKGAAGARVGSGRTPNGGAPGTPPLPGLLKPPGQKQPAAVVSGRGVVKPSIQPLVRPLARNPAGKSTAGEGPVKPQRGQKLPNRRSPAGRLAELERKKAERREAQVQRAGSRKQSGQGAIAAKTSRTTKQPQKGFQFLAQGNETVRVVSSGFNPISIFTGFFTNILQALRSLFSTLFPHPTF